jgi:hypothetical protein
LLPGSVTVASTGAAGVGADQSPGTVVGVVPVLRVLAGLAGSVEGEWSAKLKSAHDVLGSMG